MHFAKRLTAFVKSQKFLVAILLISAFFLLYKVSYVDLLGDDSHYTIRGIGYIDFMFSTKQTTPLNWLDNYPWWSNLSFHDHPPLVFFIQHVFLSLHESIFFAKLPYIIASLLTIIVVYKIVEENYNKKAALLSSMFLGLNSLFIWTGRTAYMESIVVLFISLSILYFLRFLKEEKYWWKFGLFLGLALLAKYNSMFLIPTYITCFAIVKRSIFKNKKLYYSAIVTLLVLSPVIVYNILMYKTTGHFDYQFSRLFGLDSPWQSSGASFSLSSIVSIIVGLGKTTLYPYLIVSFLGIAYLFKQRKNVSRMILFGLVYLTILFSLTGAGTYHLDLYTPFLAIPVGVLIASLLKNKKILNIYKYPVVLLFVVYLLFSLVQSHVVVGSGGYAGWTISDARSENKGVHQLDTKLDEIIKENSVLPVIDAYTVIKEKSDRLSKYVPEEIDQENEKVFKHMIIYDDDIDWFAELWPFKRRRFYHNIPVISTTEFVKIINDLVFERVYFIKATEYAPREGNSITTEVGKYIEESLLSEEITPEAVKDLEGNTTFLIYTIDLL